MHVRLLNVITIRVITILLVSDSNGITGTYRIRIEQVPLILEKPFMLPRQHNAAFLK